MQRTKLLCSAIRFLWRCRQPASVRIMHLGDKHDLAEFRQLLIEHAEESGDDTTRTTLICMIDRRRDELQALARPLGQRLYVENPKHLVARLGKYWDAWQYEGER